MFRVNEIKKWAKSHKISIKKQEEYYIWFEENNKNQTNKADTIGEVATQIYNKITNNKFVEYQKEYAESLINKISNSDALQ